MMHFARFAHPEYLLLLAVLIPLLCYLYGKQRNLRSKLILALRLTAVTLLIIAISGIQIAWGERHNAVVFVLDRSESVAPLEKSGALESINKTVAGLVPEDETGVVVFGREAVVEQPLKRNLVVSEIQSTPPATGTNIAKGISLARALLSSKPDFSRRIVLLSDGNQTSGEALKEAGLSAINGIPVDVMPLPTAAESSGRKLFLIECSGPESVRLDEPFEIDISLRGAKGTQANLQIFRDGALLTTRHRKLSGDLEFFRIQERIAAPGFHQYRVKLENDDKSRLFDNDEDGTVVYAHGRARLLHLTEKPAGFLDAILSKHGFEVVTLSPQSAPKTIHEFSPYDAVIMDNVPAADFSEEQMRSLQEHVERYAGGLIMIGSSGSFGPGGYSGTPVEKALPVEMALRNREKKPALALVLVLDKSGSMGMEQQKISKLDMAKEAVLRLSDLLSPGDTLGIIAFDRAPREVMPLVGDVDRNSVNRYIQTIAAGGGTSILPAVEMAYKWLDKSSAEKKHILLLSDGQADQSERKPLTARVAGSSIVLSTVGIGSDVDRGLMQKLAENAHGRAYFSDTGMDLPEIFKREGLLISGKWLIERSFVPHRSGEHEILQSLFNESIPEMAGYVAVTPKKLSETPLTAANEDPLLVCGRYGLGKTLAFTSDFSSPWTQRLIQWGRFPEFWAQMVRWAGRGTQNGALNGSVKVEDDTAILTVDAFDDRGNFINYEGIDARLETPGSRPVDLALVQTFSGKYEGRFPLDTRGIYPLTVTSKGNGGSSEGELHLGFDLWKLPEDKGLEPDQSFLLRIAQAAHGHVLGPNTALKSEAAAPGFKDFWPAAAILAMLFFLADLFVRRKRAISSRLQVSGSRLS